MLCYTTIYWISHYHWLLKCIIIIINIFVEHHKVATSEAREAHKMTSFKVITIVLKTSFADYYFTGNS